MASTEVAPIYGEKHVTVAGEQLEKSASMTSSDRGLDRKAEETVIEVSSDAGSDEVDNFVRDPFVPFLNLPEERKDILTVRAIVIGAICGCLVNASNIYLGLKTGWTFSANIFGCILSFAVLKFFATTCGHIPILGGTFGPKENGIAMTAATAAGGMSNVFVSAIPAIYQLKLLNTPAADYWKIVALTATGGYFGLCFAAPLRKFFIVHVARELRLTFPSSSATAVTIRAMHAAAEGAQSAKKKTKALVISFAGAIILRVVSQYAIGILWDWHFFTWFFIWGNYHNLAMHVENWGWYIEWTPAFIGAGFLVGLNVAISFFAGSVIAWGIIGPTLVKYGVAFGGPASEDPKWDQYINYFSVSAKFSKPDHPSPRFWMLWPGVLTMIVVSFVELGCQYKVLLAGGRAVARGTARGINQALNAAGRSSDWIAKKAGIEEDTYDDVDPQLPQHRIKTWMWAPGIIIVIILECVVTGKLFGMPIGETLLAIFLSFFFSLLAIQCSGATDITPLTAASKASQLILGGVTKGEHWAIEKAQRLNLLGGAVTSIGANQSADLVGDFRTGFLLGTPANIQFLAQLIGTICAVFIAPGMFVLFAKAYPCVIDLEAETCPFALPNVSSWRAVAVAMTQAEFPVPRSSGIFSIIFAVLGGIMVLMRHFVWTGEREWMRKYWPNMMVVALAFVIPQTVYGTANVMGATIAYVWAKKNAKSWEMYGYAVAAGLIAGEGIGGVINAIFQIAGIGGDKYGSQIACPGMSC